MQPLPVLVYVLVYLHGRVLQQSSGGAQFGRATARAPRVDGHWRVILIMWFTASNLIQLLDNVIRNCWKLREVWLFIEHSKRERLSNSLMYFRIAVVAFVVQHTHSQSYVKLVYTNGVSR